LKSTLKVFYKKLLKDTTYIYMFLGVFSFERFRDLPALLWMTKSV